MSRVAYVNGQYVPHRDACVHVEDRGYQFADGIYEYIAFFNRHLLDGTRHLARLERSLKALNMPADGIAEALPFIIRELIARNHRDHGGIYVQVTRGVAKRDHPFPKQPHASLVATICGPKIPKPQEVEKGVAVIIQPDQRWGRCDIKSVGLLANVLAKQAASAAGVREAWLTKTDGTVTEGAVSNAYIVLEGGELVTHPANESILCGITRDVVLELARKNGVTVSERPFHVSEIAAAQEAFITSTSANVLPVTKVDGKPLGNGKPGPVTQKLLALYLGHVEKQTGFAL